MSGDPAIVVLGPGGLDLAHRIVGAVPGALPPLIGWAAASGTLPPAAWSLFLILFFWQIPHFLAIAMYRKDEYARADLVVLPNTKGDRAVRFQMVAYTAVLVAVSLSLVFVGTAGWLYFVVAAVLGAWFFMLTIVGSQNSDSSAWGRKIFIASLIYLPVLALGLVVDVVIG